MEKVKKKLKKDIMSVETDAVTVVNKGLKKDIAAAQSLKDAGLTASFDEFV